VDFDIHIFIIKAKDMVTHKPADEKGSASCGSNFFCDRPGYIQVPAV
jgi:hypothetical protein